MKIFSNLDYQFLNQRLDWYAGDDWIKLNNNPGQILKIPPGNHMVVASSKYHNKHNCDAVNALWICLNNSEENSIQILRILFLKYFILKQTSKYQTIPDYFYYCSLLSCILVILVIYLLKCLFNFNIFFTLRNWPD